MIQIVVFPLYYAVTGAIVFLVCIGITAEWSASRLTQLQKLLAKVRGQK